jgi:hypothetical protein
MKKPIDRKPGKRKRRRSQVSRDESPLILHLSEVQLPKRAGDRLRILALAALVALAIFPFALLASEAISGTVEICAKGCATYSRTDPNPWAFWGTLAIKGAAYLVVVAVSLLGIASARSRS